MKDRFLLRIWDDKKQKMIYGARKGEMNPSWVLACCYANDVEPYQCTGRKDVNEKLIFEGDIVEEYNEDGLICIKEVRFIENTMCGFNINTEYDYKIIGNVDATPDLLI